MVLNKPGAGWMLYNAFCVILKVVNCGNLSVRSKQLTNGWFLYAERIEIMTNWNYEVLRKKHAGFTDMGSRVKLDHINLKKKKADF